MGRELQKEKYTDKNSLYLSRQEVASMKNLFDLGRFFDVAGRFLQQLYNFSKIFRYDRCMHCIYLGFIMYL